MTTIAMGMLEEEIERLSAENAEFKRIIDAYDEEEDFATRTARRLVAAIDINMQATIDRDLMERIVVLAHTKLNKPEEGEDVHFHIV
jgi:uncharacterized membrane protein YgaE (UPF0421/DUF939 family)